MGRDNMKKTRKRKNLKLRRQIRRTVAALFMIMAVVVAAIPVENLGTMQAAGVPAYSAIIGAKADAKKVSSDEDEEKYDDNDELHVQRIVTGENSELHFANVYTVQRLSTNSSNAMITRYDGTNASSFEIEKSGYYDYLYFDDAFLTQMKTALSNEKYTLGVKSGSDTANFNACKCDVDTIVGAKQQLEAVKITKLDYSSPDNIIYGYENISEQNIVSSTNKKYNKITGFTTDDEKKDYVKNLFNSNTSLNALVQEQINLIVAYNEKADKRINELKAIQDKINNNTAISKDEFDKWNTYARECNTTNGDFYKEFKNAESKAYSYSDLAISLYDSNKKGISDIEEFTICQRAKNGNVGLSNYELVRVKDQNSNYLFVPKNITGLFESGQYVDNNKYLVGGDSVTITAIGNGAFKGSGIGEVIIPDSISFIGNDAFKDCSSLKSVSLADKNCKYIADGAFSGCRLLNSFTFVGESGLEKIGNETFLDAQDLTSIVFPRTIKEVGAGAFQDSGLETVVFNEPRYQVTLHPFAFGNCYKLQTVDFQTGTFFFETGAFALTSNGSEGVMEEFIYPANNTTLRSDVVIKDSEGNLITNDYVFAGRENLHNVTFPNNLGERENLPSGQKSIPDGTFYGCYNLKTVTFPKFAYEASYSPDKLFTSVYNVDGSFCVIGPATRMDGDYAIPRKTTWNAIDGNGNAVPYQYTVNDNTFWEYGVPVENQGTVSSPFVASIKVLDAANKEALLSNYMENPSNKIQDGQKALIVIPDRVNDYNVVEIGSNCIDKTMKDKIYEIVIGNNVRKINDSAFEDVTSVEWVKIGYGIQYIGANAFNNCTSLLNVEFDQTKTSTWTEDSTYDSSWSELVIGENAFSTKSPYLTFHGAINPNYAPYQLAMSENSVNMTGTKAQICYKTDAPLNLTVIRDRGTGKSTLVDYPHYEEIDALNEEYRLALGASYLGESAKGNYSLVGKFEHVKKIKENAQYGADAEMEELESNIVEQIFDMKIPYGIESIDSNAFYSNASNSPDLYYVSRVYKDEKQPDSSKKYFSTKLIDRVMKNSSSIDKIYSAYREQDTADDSYSKLPAGLFSAYIKEQSNSISTNSSNIINQNVELNGHKYVENRPDGNDYLTTLQMPSVESIPEYGFLSCENLKNITLGSKLDKVGVLPFKGCVNLYDINGLNENSKFDFENLIFYENLSENSNARSTEKNYKIIQVLEGRGKEASEFGTKNITLELDPKLEYVSELADYAFEDCTNLIEVDLSSTKLSTVPSYAFIRCDALTSVIMPETLTTIQDYAFTQINSQFLTVEIPSPYTVVSAKSFDNNKALIYIKGIQYLDEGAGKTSPAYNSFKILEKTLGKDKIQWKEKGQSYTVSFLDSDLSLIKSFEIDAGTDIDNPPANPSKTGLKFDGWKCRIEDTVLAGDEVLKNVRENRIIVATYKPDPSTVVSDGNKYSVTVKGSGIASAKNADEKYVSGNSITDIYGGENVTLFYNGSDKFSSWIVTTDAGTVTVENASNASGATFTMPNANVTVTITTGTSGSDNNSNNSGTGDNSNNNNNNQNGGNNNTTDTTTKYKVTVNYGSGSGDYAAGETVTISAFAPESSTKVFSKWTTTNSGLGFADANKSTTTFTMPAAAVVVTANYKTRSASDDYDYADDNVLGSANRRPVGNVSTVTTTQNPETVTVTTTTTTETKPQSTTDSDKLYIDKNGVSNKDVGSAEVTGSTDNFVIKISDSNEAAEAAKVALLNRFGSLDGIAYFPFDLSLYDATGRTKITDTYGLNVTVTMPIPDVLIQYGGNVRIAAIEGGYLNELPVRYKSIERISCVSYTPPHFSPYVLYVDTNNLIASTSLDSTPQTGDPIHPKWFLATGMACLSILLFVTGDRKRKIKLA